MAIVTEQLSGGQRFSRSLHHRVEMMRLVQQEKFHPLQQSHLSEPRVDPGTQELDV